MGRSGRPGAALEVVLSGEEAVIVVEGSVVDDDAPGDSVSVLSAFALIRSTAYLQPSSIPMVWVLFDSWFN